MKTPKISFRNNSNRIKWAYLYFFILMFLGIGRGFAQDKIDSQEVQFTPLERKSIAQALRLLSHEKAYQGIKLSKQLVPYSVVRDQSGLTHVKFTQRHPDGIPVFKKRIGVHIKNKKIYFISGHFEKGLEKIRTRPNILETEAVELARQLLQEKGSRELEFKTVELVILGFRFSPDKEPHLVWRVVFEEPIHRWNVFIDAHEGKVLLQFDDICTGTGSGDYTGGDVSLDTYFNSSSYFMQDTTRNVSTYSAGYAESLGSLTLYGDSDDYWGGSTDTDQLAAVDAHYHAAWVYDYYYNELGRDGLNGSGGSINLVVHYGSGYNNAHWNGTYAYFGDGDGTNRSSFATLDVVAHELTHGVDDYTSDLVYSGESGGLDEAYADIFGTCIEFYAEENGYGRADWWHGEDNQTPGTPEDAGRYMDNPTQDGVSIDHYSQYSDSLDVHYSSGIANNAFYLLSEGGTNSTSGLSVTGIGIDAAAQIFYHARVNYLESDATFLDTALAALQSAEDIYGAPGTQVLAVSEAWQAVGVLPTIELEGDAMWGDEAVVMEPNVPTQVTINLSWPTDEVGLAGCFMRGASGVSKKIAPRRRVLSGKGETEFTMILQSSSELGPVEPDLICRIFFPSSGAIIFVVKNLTIIAEGDTPYGTSISSDFALAGQEIEIGGLNLENTTSVTFTSGVSASFSIDTSSGTPILAVEVPTGATDGPISLDGVEVEDGKTFTIADTIQEAIELSEDGAEILVPAGTYQEDLVIKNKSISLVSEEGPELTIIQGQSSSSPVVTIYGDITQEVKISGFTFEHASSVMYVIYAYNLAGLVVQDNIGQIEDAYFVSAWYIPTVEVDGNTLHDMAHLCYIEESDVAKVKNNLVISENLPYAVFLYNTQTENEIVNNTIWDDNPSSRIVDLGFVVGGSSSGIVTTMANNIVTGNLVAGIYNYYYSGTLSLLSNCVYTSGYNYYGVSDPTGTDGNISADPLLDTDGRLTSSSPCIDSATDASGYDVTEDIDGDSRPQDGDSDGTASYDIGADEFIP